MRGVKNSDAGGPEKQVILFVWPKHCATVNYTHEMVPKNSYSQYIHARTKSAEPDTKSMIMAAQPHRGRPWVSRTTFPVVSEVAASLDRRPRSTARTPRDLISVVYTTRASEVRDTMSDKSPKTSGAFDQGHIRVVSSVGHPEDKQDENGLIHEQIWTSHN